MAEHGTITGYRKLACRKRDNCPASPTCAEVKAGARSKVVAPIRAAAVPQPGAVAAPRPNAGPQGEALRLQYAGLDDAARGRVAVLLAAADALAFVIDYGAAGLVAPAVKALREIEIDIQDRTGGGSDDEFDALMASLADVPATVRDGAELRS